MATDPNPALRAELVAALADIDPTIRGFDDFDRANPTPELDAAFDDYTALLHRRRDLEAAAVTAYDALVAALARLEGDGYPTVLTLELEPLLFSEFQGIRRDMDAASARVAAALVAATATFIFPPPTPKP